jgi:hypothetical protein
MRLPQQGAQAFGVSPQPGSFQLPDISSRIPLQYRQVFDRFVLACKRVMYDPKTHALMQRELAKNVPMAQKLAEGVCGLVLILYQEQKGKVPAPVLIPAAVELIGDAVGFLTQAVTAGPTGISSGQNPRGSQTIDKAVRAGGDAGDCDSVEKTRGHAATGVGTNHRSGKLCCANRGGGVAMGLLSGISGLAGAGIAGGVGSALEAGGAAEGAQLAKSASLKQSAQQDDDLAQHTAQYQADRANAIADYANQLEQKDRQQRVAVVSQAHDDWGNANAGLAPTPYQSAMISADALTRAGYAKEGQELAHAGLYIGTGDWRGRQKTNPISPDGR